MPADRPPDLELTLPATAASVTIARQAIHGLFDVLRWDEHRRSDVAIAVTEACTNVVMHAYPQDAPGDYRVDAWAEPTRLEVAVRDHGTGLSPRLPSRSPGLGLGLQLILAIGDHVEMGTAEDGAATEVRMTFTPTGGRAHA